MLNCIKVIILPNKKGILSRVTAFNPSILSGRGPVMDHSEESALNISVSDLVCFSCLPHPPVTRYTTAPSSAQYQAQAWFCLPWLRLGKSSMKHVDMLVFTADGANRGVLDMYGIGYRAPV